MKIRFIGVKGGSMVLSLTKKERDVAITIVGDPKTDTAHAYLSQWTK